MSIKAKLINRTKSIFLLLCNLYRSLKLKPIEENRVDGFLIRKMRIADLKYINELYIGSKELGNGKGISRYNKLLLSIVGYKICFIIIKDDRLVGYQFFYFNFCDLKQGTIHSVSGGISQDVIHSGIGLLMMENSFSWFMRNKNLKGITCRIFKENKRSLKAHQYFGFNIIDENITEKGEKQYYLKSSFSKRDI